MSAQQLLSQLANLDEDELREAGARVSLLLGSRTKGTEDDPTELGIVYDEMQQSIRKITGQKPMPFSVFAGTKYGVSFKKNAKELMTYARENLKPKGRAGMIQAIRLLMELIVRQIHLETKVRLSLGPVSQQLGRVSEIVDSQFPGYAASGLLPIVLNRGHRLG